MIFSPRAFKKMEKHLFFNLIATNISKSRLFLKPYGILSRYKRILH